MDISYRNRVRIALSGKDIVEMLRQSGRPVPDGASVVFEIPSDWAGDPRPGEKVGISASCPVVIEWEEPWRK